MQGAREKCQDDPVFSMACSKLQPPSPNHVTLGCLEYHSYITRNLMCAKLSFPSESQPQRCRPRKRNLRPVGKCILQNLRVNIPNHSHSLVSEGIPAVLG